MAVESKRIFKTAWFAKASKKARILDDELCKAVREVCSVRPRSRRGVFKKRLGMNLYQDRRSLPEVVSFTASAGHCVASFHQGRAAVARGSHRPRMS
jgi:hypothetical protein